MVYVSRPRAERWVRPGVDDDEDVMVSSAGQPATITVHEEDIPWTGLFDASGNKIYREREPIGFRFSDNE